MLCLLQLLVRAPMQHRLQRSMHEVHAPFVTPDYACSPGQRIARAVHAASRSSLHLALLASGISACGTCQCCTHAPIPLNPFLQCWCICTERLQAAGGQLPGRPADGPGCSRQGARRREQHAAVPDQPLRRRRRQHQAGAPCKSLPPLSGFTAASVSLPLQQAVCC